jgi:quercetin dioxygenase-like cupin family protein
VITLSGRLEFETRAGKRQIVEPGDILLADTSGGGHRWRLIDDQPWRRVYVALERSALQQERKAAMLTG